MSFEPKQFRELVVRPTLEYLGPEIPYSNEAEDLLVMTAAHESHLGKYLKQVNGPALGVYQMESATHNDIWASFLQFRNKLFNLMFSMVRSNSPNTLVYDLQYATAMARVHYFRDRNPIPKESEYKTRAEYINALGAYAKRVYNTELGKATAEQYVKDYLKYGV